LAHRHPDADGDQQGDDGSADRQRSLPEGRPPMTWPDFGKPGERCHDVAKTRVDSSGFPRSQADSSNSPDASITEGILFIASFLLRA
jgi:hypothetical protein